MIHIKLTRNYVTQSPLFLVEGQIVVSANLSTYFNLRLRLSYQCPHASLVKLTSRFAR